MRSNILFYHYHLRSKVDITFYGKIIKRLSLPRVFFIITKGTWDFILNYGLSRKYSLAPAVWKINCETSCRNKPVRNLKRKFYKIWKLFLQKYKKIFCTFKPANSLLYIYGRYLFLLTHVPTSVQCPENIGLINHCVQY